MLKITILVGLPGSGKTYLGKQMALDLGIPFFDDCATEESTWLDAVECIKDGYDCILADPKFCRSDVYGSLCSKIVSIMPSMARLNNIYFENDPDTCVRNVRNRKDGRKVLENHIYRLSREYTPSMQGIRPCYGKLKVK